LSQGGQILRIFDVCADGLREMSEKVSTRGRKLVATDEPPVVTKPRSSWRTVRVVDVLPIPPAPIRAISVRRCAKRTIFSTNSPHPKNALGGGGGSSSGTLDVNVRCWIPR